MRRHPWFALALALASLQAGASSAPLSESLQRPLLNPRHLTLAAADSALAGYYRRDDRLLGQDQRDIGLTGVDEPLDPVTEQDPLATGRAREPAAIQVAALEPAPKPMRGQYRYLADSTRFTDCASGRSYPVAQGGDSPVLERAYLEHRSEPGAWLTVSFTGYLGQQPGADTQNSEEAIVVDRFDAVWPGEGCEGPGAVPTLEGTEWKLVEIEGRPLSAAEHARNPRLQLEPDRLQAVGYAGCNRFFGGYRRSGETGLAFEQIASTRRYCMEGMDLERAVLRALAESAGYRIANGCLELLDGTGKGLAVFEPAPAQAIDQKP